MQASISGTPFGNPDGSRSDIQEVVDNFITFDDLPVSSGLGLRPDDFSRRVIVGAKGSGKTVYLRRLRDAVSHNESVYADTVQQELPATGNIVKFCQCFRPNELTEKWTQLWYCAIMRSLATHLLHAPQLTEHLSSELRDELESYPPDIVPARRRPAPVYSQVTEIIQANHTAQAFSRYFDRPDWSELAATVHAIIPSLPPIYFFIDSVDEEYASAPMYWLRCQEGLFYRAMRFLRDSQLGGRVHVVVCVRDHVLASVLRSEHQNRYRGEPHIAVLGWEYLAAELFLKRKLSRLGPQHMLRDRTDGMSDVERWLGHRFIENLGRRVQEPILQYLLRHTRLLPRDIVILGNRLSELAAGARAQRASEVAPSAIRSCVRDLARSFGNEQLAICANHIASSSMPADAARRGYDSLYTGESEYSRGLVEDLRTLIQTIGKDRFGPDELRAARQLARTTFGEQSDALSVLWQNRLLGYVDLTPDGPREIFFSELNADHFSLPLDKSMYLFHSSMIDAVGIQAVGAPVGQGAMHDSGAASGSQRPDPGRLGQYTILGVIGKGGMGTVFKAEDTRLRRQVALKLLPASTHSESGTAARFRREAQLLASLNHPNIATIYSLEDDGDVHFISMEFVPGSTLAQILQSGPLPVARTAHVCRQIATALRAAHDRGVIHRDLKPSNVMLTPQDQVKVLDFGLAKTVGFQAHPSDSTLSQMDPLTAGDIVGTRGYMSPEQLRGEDLDHRCDLWALGCCLYECLFGRMAFPGLTPAERAAATLERDPSQEGSERLPPGIRDLLRRCLEKDPRARLASAEEAMAVLEESGAAT